MKLIDAVKDATVEPSALKVQHRWPANLSEDLVSELGRRSACQGAPDFTEDMCIDDESLAINKLPERPISLFHQNLDGPARQESLQRSVFRNIEDVANRAAVSFGQPNCA